MLYVCMYVSNNFVCIAELALLHNDKSPLENMHCAVLYEMLRQPNLNIFVNLTEQQWRDSRKIINHCILDTTCIHIYIHAYILYTYMHTYIHTYIHSSIKFTIKGTDMAHHFEQIKNTQLFMEASYSIHTYSTYISIHTYIHTYNVHLWLG